VHYPESKYVGKSFEETLEISDENTKNFYLPHIIKAGFSVNPKQDSWPLSLSKEEKENYINPNDNNAYSGIRSPDLLAFCGSMSASIPFVFFEIKDFARLGIWPLTGFPVRLDMRYIALQHMYKIPVIILFRDYPREASGNIPALTKSPYGFNIPYGGLLWDLPICSVKSWNIDHINHKNGKRYPQILWKTEDDEGNPTMLTIYEIAETIKRGLIKMKTIDPLDPKLGELWRITNNKDRLESVKGTYKELKPMSVPEGGLNIFTISKTGTSSLR